MNQDLIAIGDSLERAIAVDIAEQRNMSAAAGHVRGDHTNAIEEDPMLTTDQVQPHRNRRRTRRIATISAVVVLCVGGGVAAAVSRMSSDDVSHGLPGGSALFEGTNPSCSSTDGVVFQCTLASVPTVDVTDDYTGSAELFVDKDLNIAGGCRGQSADGLKWTCYLGQRAVDEQILVADLLGQHEPTPGRG